MNQVVIDSMAEWIALIGAMAFFLLLAVVVLDFVLHNVKEIVNAAAAGIAFVALANMIVGAAWVIAMLCGDVMSSEDLLFLQLFSSIMAYFVGFFFFLFCFLDDKRKAKEVAESTAQVDSPPAGDSVGDNLGGA